MSNNNKSVKRQLEKIYGKGCMFKRAHISDRLLQLDLKITGYRLYVSETRYKCKKIEKLESTMTYHHLKHRSEGGETSIENGAVVSELAHRYLHSLPREQEEIINNMLREYKQDFELRGGIITPTENGLEVVQPLKISLDFDIPEEDCVIIPVYDDEEKPKKFNRASVKQETRRLIDKVLEELDDEDNKYLR